MKRIFDLFCSLLGLIILFPIFLMIILIIYLDSRGGPFYNQTRVGRYNRDFKLWKFRSMRINSDKQGLLTIGNNDSRITKVGVYLRKYKLDELPQLFNVLVGNMSLVGPRPEVRKYVDLYTKDQKVVLNLKPGITDMASIKYRDENDILKKYDEPEQAYVRIVMPDKIQINLNYYSESQSVSGSVKIIVLTILAIMKR
jgi:lipopolysaccharide/colanic/teichoic acid biosynthesis glycosyltransferase